MTLALAQLLRDAGTTQPNRLVLMSPWLDVTCSDPEQEFSTGRTRYWLCLAYENVDGGTLAHFQQPILV
jgi:acetyl esterase/lipase